MPFKYFTVEPVEKVQDVYSMNCSINSVGNPSSVSFEYRFIYNKTDEEQGASNWLAYTIGNTISNSRNEWFAVQFRNTSGTLSISAYDYFQFTFSEKINVSGNIMTLLDYRNEVQLYTQCFRNLFFGCNTLIDASELRLTATTLAGQCYMNMFSNCQYLTKAPELIATTLATQCYYGMFTGCSSLNQLVYSSNVVPSPSTRSGNSAYWLSDVSPTGTFYYTDKDLDISQFVRTPSGIPAGWSIEYKKEPGRSFSIGGKTVGSSLYIDGQSVKFLFINGGLVWGTYEPQPTWAGLKFKSTQDGSTVKMVKVGSRAPDVSLEYSIDKGETWQDFIVFSSSTSSDGTLVLLNADNELWLRANNPNSTFSEAATYYNSCVMTGVIGESGNIMSLLDKDTFETDTSLAGKTRCFSTLFKDCASLTSAPELPATTLVDYCYQYMFQNCTSLASAPELPATALSSNCYYGMFQNCTSLSSTPELPATTLAQNCYRSMFQDCTSLTQAPQILPATTLVNICYGYMFRTCTSLVQAPELPATTVGNSCYGYMFQKCSSLKRIKMNASSGTWGPGMFAGCSSLELVDMTGSIGVPQLGNINNFANTNDTYKIVVPDSLYNDWIAATNWSDASIKPHIMKQSDWNSAHPDDQL